MLKRQVDIIQQLLDPRKIEKQDTPDYSLPKISSLEDVYETGVLCNIRVFKDDKNLFMPYILNLFPYEKARVVSPVLDSEKIAPLSRVIVEKIHEELLQDEDLSLKDSVIFKFLKQQYLKCFKIAPDDRFLQYLTALERNFDLTQVQSFIHMVLTCISMPQYVNTYKFLINSNRHSLQEVF